MAVSATSGSSANASTAVPNTATTTLNGDTFMKLFTQEISNQNPMEPMKSSDFLNQFAQVSSVQTMSALQSTMNNLSIILNSISASQAQGSAQGLVGRQISYASANGSLQQDTVISVRLTPGQYPQLIIKDGSAIALGALRQVS